MRSDNAAICKIMRQQDNVGQDKSFWAGAVFCTIACHLPIPEEENEDLSAPLHMYSPTWYSHQWARTVLRNSNQGLGAQQLHSQNTFVLPTTYNWYFFGSGFAICLLHCWPSICWVSTLPNNSSVVPEWSFLLLSPSVWAFVSPLCLCVCTFNLLWRP